MSYLLSVVVPVVGKARQLGAERQRGAPGPDLLVGGTQHLGVSLQHVHLVLRAWGAGELEATLVSKTGWEQNDGSSKPK
jgi:hypothetical protein